MSLHFQIFHDIARNSVLAQVGTLPSDTVAVEGGNNFFLLETLLLAVTKKLWNSYGSKCSCICYGMAFQAILSTQECLFPLLILAGLYSPQQKPITSSTFYHKTCEVDTTTEVLLTLILHFFFFPYLLFLPWIKSKGGTDYRYDWELQLWVLRWSSQKLFLTY